MMQRIRLLQHYFYEEFHKFNVIYGRSSGQTKPLTILPGKQVMAQLADEGT